MVGDTHTLLACLLNELADKSPETGQGGPRVGSVPNTAKFSHFKTVLRSKMPPNEAPVTAIYREHPDEDDRNGSPVVRKVAPVPVDQIRVEDKLYSTERLAEMHPGGPIFIRVRSRL